MHLKLWKVFILIRFSACFLLSTPESRLQLFIFSQFKGLLCWRLFFSSKKDDSLTRKVSSSDLFAINRRNFAILSSKFFVFICHTCVCVFPAIAGRAPPLNTVQLLLGIYQGGYPFILDEMGIHGPVHSCWWEEFQASANLKLSELKTKS